MPTQIEEITEGKKKENKTSLVEDINKTCIFQFGTFLEV